MNLRMITIIRQRMFQRGLFSINQAVRGRRVRCTDQFRSIRVRDRPLCEPIPPNPRTRRSAQRTLRTAGRA